MDGRAQQMGAAAMDDLVVHQAGAREITGALAVMDNPAMHRVTGQRDLHDLSRVAVRQAQGEHLGVGEIEVVWEEKNGAGSVCLGGGHQGKITRVVTVSVPSVGLVPFPEGRKE